MHPTRGEARVARKNTGLGQEDYRGVRCLVLGAAGFIGRWTVRALSARGADLAVVVREGPGAAALRQDAGPGVRLIVEDLAHPDAIGRIIEASDPSIVFNLAGYGVDRAERSLELMAVLNTRLVERLCESLDARPRHSWNGLRLVHAGSALEYGRIGAPLTEASAPWPDTPYGRTKLEGTRALAACCARTGLRAIVARLFTVYGPGEQSDRLLPSLLRTARTGLPLALTSGRQRRSFTYVEDVAEGLLRLGLSGAGPGDVVNLADGTVTTVREFAETASAVLQFDRRLLDFGALPDREDEMWHGAVDVTRLRTLTSWLPPTAIADGIRRTRDRGDAG